MSYIPVSSTLPNQRFFYLDSGTQCGYDPSTDKSDCSPTIKTESDYASAKYLCSGHSFDSKTSLTVQPTVSTEASTTGKDMIIHDTHVHYKYCLLTGHYCYKHCLPVCL